MNNLEFYIRQGNIVRSSDPGFQESCVGNGLDVMETMWFANGEIPFFNLHMQRFENLLRFFGRPWPGEFPPHHEILRLCRRLVNKNKAFMGGWVKGTFHLSRKKNSFSAGVVPFPDRRFPFIQEGLPAIISPFVKLSGNPLAGFPLTPDLLRNAEAFRNDKPVIPLFLNEKGAVTDAADATLFGIRKNSLVTPSAATGCRRTLYHDFLLRAAGMTGFQVVETEDLTLPLLMECDEIFTLSEECGFRWITGIEDKRFVKTQTTLIWKQFLKSSFPGDI